MKSHYKAVQKNDTIAFVPCSGDDRFTMYWCGGGDQKIPYILQTLIHNHGVEEGKAIYQKFNQALLETSQQDLPNGKKVAVLVKYIKDESYCPPTERFS